LFKKKYYRNLNNLSNDRVWFPLFSRTELNLKIKTNQFNIFGTQ